MERSTIVTLLIVVGLGGLALWWYLDSPTSTTAAQPVPGSCGSGVMGSIGNFIKGHVDRKNAVAPQVAGAYAKAPASQLKGFTDAAGKLSPSNYLETKVGKAVGDFFCKVSLDTVSHALAQGFRNTAVDAGGAVVNFGQTTTGVGKSQLTAGTIGPVKSLYSASSNLIHGNFGDAGKDLAKSIYEGPKSAVKSTINAVKSLNPF